ncbi:hypothetical protein PR202_gb14374 [Eleusine coracana subsp. coracana]|uniref:Germin-like protein n=1 Tax=Eleusine coracana subsp. coracana TaxID=191504 RepID=A0AAV5EWM8_ELECO|nr:hypothetical protein QOZ80_4BG0334710 [Eleusine coracana subsp. coracana]GJN26446.1 hypothetical protein PR202_gb14374 [Eleusine coracana subsp. coracana]
MASRSFAAVVTVLAFVVFASVPRALATDPTQLQDFCVADRTQAVIVNGFVCKNPKMVTANDFFLKIMPMPINAQGSAVTPISVMELAGLNTLGISMARIDFAPGGQNPPHTHPRGTEILVVIQGTLLVGFVGSNQNNNMLFQKQLVAGDVFVFPQGLIHFQLNNGKTPALAFAALSSQNPGVITIANSVFGTMPPISADILARAFMVDKDQVDWIQKQFAMPAMGGGGGMMPGGGAGNATGGGYPGGNSTGGGYGYP